MSLLQTEDRNQMSKETLKTLVGETITSVDFHGSHGPEYVLRLSSGRALYFTHIDYT